jgi:hypothetical protein
MKKLTLILLCTLSLNAYAEQRTIHVFVALCDNENQGIIPVPEKLGNGQDPFNNLYWGALYGVKSYFKRSDNWTLVSSEKNPTEGILERLLFKHNSTDTYLLADAYDGREIQQCTINFFKACAGDGLVTFNHKQETLQFGGSSSLLCYVGHDGLMEFDLEESFTAQDDKKREAIMLACVSKDYFSQHLKESGAYPLLWTTQLMAPEAYTLEAAAHSWCLNKSKEEIRLAGAEAYHKYQKCGLNGAKGLLVQGWE